MERYPSSQIIKLNIVKIAIDLIAISIKISGAFFAEVMFLKFTWKFKELHIAKTILKNRVGFQIVLIDFKACYKAVLVKIVWYSLKDRHMYQWNTTGVQKLALTIVVNWFPKRYHVCLQGKLSFFFFLRNGAKKLDIHMNKAEFRSLFHTLCKN